MRGLLLLLLVVSWSQGQANASPAKLGQAQRAFERGNYAKAQRIALSLRNAKLLNRDHALYIAAQSAFMQRDYGAALDVFRELATVQGSRFAERARWRAADTLWNLGQTDSARAAYWDLVSRAGRRSFADLGLARYRIAEASARAGETERAKAEFVRFLIKHPGHVYEAEGWKRLRALDESAAQLSNAQRLERATELRDKKDWQEAILELAQIPSTSVEEKARISFLRGMTLFRMRRHYGRAAGILLDVAPKLGASSAEAAFHGARALSRADKDREAIRKYLDVVERFPGTKWADEAHYLAGWLWFNLGEYKRAIPILVAARGRKPRTRFEESLLWYQGMSHFLLKEYALAIPLFEQLSKRKGRLLGGKGSYWLGRSLSLLGRKDEAIAEFRKLVTAHPFSWYALLAQARSKELGVMIPAFGDATPVTINTKLSGPVSKRVLGDPLIKRVDELLAAKMPEAAAAELARGERGLIRRHKREDALRAILRRYAKAQNFNRPWMLASIYGGTTVLNTPPKGPARAWWKHAYPQAFRKLVEKWRKTGGSPPYYLFAIMRKESGFNPRTHSYADAQGLLQMIPPTTRRVAKRLGLTYADGMLFDPNLNVRTGAWYIGGLFKKFQGQVPFAAASYNAGPRAMIRWIEKNANGRPMDEFVELVSYNQARNYMRRVTETYARYLYLYENKLYEQPLEVNATFLDDELTY